MKKRSNDSSQLRPEEVEGLNNEEAEDPGTFQKASQDEIATRKIVKVKRAIPAPSNNTPALVSSNPFATFQGLTSASAPIPPPANNPFAGFSGLTSSSAPTAAKNAFVGFEFPTSNVSTLPNNNSNPTELKSTHSNVSTNESEYQKKVKKLNQAFLNWTDRQIKENAIAVWKDGVKDYIKYQKSLKEKYPLEANKVVVPTKVAEVPPSIASASVVTAPQIKKVDDAPKEPSKSFTFPATPSLPSAPPSQAKAAPSFSFGTTSAPTTAPSSIVGFGAPSTGSSTFSFNPTGSSSFAFPTSSSSFAASSTGGFGSFNLPSATNNIGDNVEGGDDGGDDEGEPILEPEKILRNENDKDEILLEVPCKLLGYSKELSEWRDKGKGSFRLTKDPTTSKKRMLVRNTMGKITFNAAFYKGMKVDRHKDSLLFSAFVARDESSKPDFQRFTLKLKAEDCSKVKAELENCIAEM